MTIPLAGSDSKPILFVEEDFAAEGGDFSPNGRYLAFESEETGQWEVYIRPYPGRGPQVTVSVGGGREPVWASSGDLFYRSLTGEQMFAVSVVTDPDAIG